MNESLTVSRPKLSRSWEKWIGFHGNNQMNQMNAVQNDENI